MKAVILGAGESGYGSAVLARSKGFETFVSDFGVIDKRYKKALEERGIEYEEGQHSTEKIADANIVVKSPGIPETAPVIRMLRERRVEVISEIEFAGRYTQGKCICVTGSNGKTTTTTLIYEILCAAGYDVAVGGNIGSSFALSVATGDKEWYVLEVSSFQLDDTYDFRADVAVLTNITPDHLDRYDYKFENYAASKFQIIRNQRSYDFFIYNADDATVGAGLEIWKPEAKELPFTLRGSVSQGAWLAGDDMVIVRAGGRNLEIEVGRMRIKGRHNVANAMAAALAAMVAGVDERYIKDTLYSFGGVEHRMEPAGEIDGVEYINDSKATNVDSAWYALESMRRPTIWIAGGTDKGNDYGPLKDFARDKVKALVCMGVDNGKLKEAFKDIIPLIYDTHSLEEAMEMCHSLACEGDAVLLSPACASFDLFRNYEDRGEQFKEWIVRHRG